MGDKKKLIQEVGLKRLYLSMFGASGGIPPNDVEKLKEIFKQYAPGADQEARIKEAAKDSINIYDQMMKWQEIPKGKELYGYGLPPAVKRLYEIILKEKAERRVP